MSGRPRKVLLLLLAAALLAGVGRVQQSLNRDRDLLGLTRTQPLENAPPVLAFTTVALGGFRGLIANALWMRAVDLQDEGKYFEMVQLADWITKLEPHYVQVWLVQAWNMAYNISVKFKETSPGQFPDRWRWVQRGIELLRDDGLRYNPNEVLIYRELGWFFQHKIGVKLDDAHMYYRLAWYNEMTNVLKDPHPNFEELIAPQTDDAKARAELLRKKFKMDPARMKGLDDRFGPLEWRLPEAHAIYWATLGLDQAKREEHRVNKELVIQLRRVVYQSMQQSVQHGRVTFLIAGGKGLDLGPNLEFIPKANQAYEQMMAEEDEPDRSLTARAQRNFLRDAIYWLYVYDRKDDATQWYRYLAQKYPNQPLLNDSTNLPGSLALEDYCLARAQEDRRFTGEDRIRILVQGSLKTAFRLLAEGENKPAAFFRVLAQRVYDDFQAEVTNRANISIPSFKVLEQDVLNGLLDPEGGELPPELQAGLRTLFGSVPTNAPPATRPTTNTPPNHQ